MTDTPDGVETDATLASSKSQGAARLVTDAALSGNARYDRGRELGRGGMGRVVEAVDRQFNRVVAIKELLEGGDERTRRFATEVHVTGNLEHPGIPSVYERGVDDRGLPFYAMRKVRGQTLGASLAEARTLADRLALLNAVVKTAQTLGYAHEHGVIHRDVKPDNVIVGPYGDVVLLDWGIARVRALGVESTNDASPKAAAAGTGTSTLFGSIMGTPAYMSPEQAAGLTDAIDERTDVFALGALLYQLLTGRPPYSGSNVDDVLSQARTGTVRGVLELEPQAPAALAAICAQAMSKNPNDRYRNATELASALEQFQSRAFLARPAPRGIALVINAITIVAVGVTFFSLVMTIATMPSMREMGVGALFTILAAVIGATLSGLEWFTRGRYVLAPLAMGFALATLCGGIASVASGMTTVFRLLQPLAAQPEKYRELMAAGAYESMGGLTLGAVLAGAQFLLWSLARRRTLRSDVGPSSAAASTFRIPTRA